MEVYQLLFQAGKYIQSVRMQESMGSTANILGGYSVVSVIIQAGKTSPIATRPAAHLSSRLLKLLLTTSHNVLLSVV